MNQTIKVLIVENNFIMQQFLVNYLKDDYFVTAVDNVEEGIGILESNELEITMVITDINMTSGQDGYDLIRYIKNSETPLPTLVVSSNEQSSDRVHALQLGADDYIVKPFNPEELKIRLHKLLKQPVMD